MVMRRYVSRLLVLLLLAGVAEAAPTTPTLPINGCGESLEACTDCCAHAACCCEESGGSTTSECDFDDSIPGQTSCSLPGCFGGEQECEGPCVAG